MNTIIVTRHPALLQYLEEVGTIIGDEPIIEHATPQDVQDKHVIGVLPLLLACLALSVTEVPLVLPQELRGKELTIDQVRMYAQEPVTYKVTKEL